MDSIDLIRTFQEVATYGSFTRAAARLDMSKTTVSKYVAELEKRFGIRLLNRSTRSVSLTDAGALLLQRSAPVMELLQLTHAELSAHASRPTGRLRISAPHGMSQGTFPSLLAQFMGYYPEVTISLHLSNRAIDMAEEAIDVALILGPLANENLIVRKLRHVSMVVCASPAYWEKNGAPELPADLSSHVALTNSRLGQHPVWRFEADGTPIDVPVASRMDASEGGPLIEASLRGLGVLYVPAITVQAHLDSGELVAVLHPYARSDVWLSAAYLQRRHNSAALKAFLDFLATRLGGSGQVAS